MEDELRQKIAILKHELSQKDKQVEEVKEASRKIYTKNEYLEADNETLLEALNEMAEKIKELQNRIFELDLLGTVSINEQRKLMQEIYDLKTIK